MCDRQTPAVVHRLRIIWGSLASPSCLGELGSVDLSYQSYSQNDRPSIIIIHVFTITLLHATSLSWSIAKHEYNALIEQLDCTFFSAVLYAQGIRSYNMVVKDACMRREVSFFVVFVDSDYFVLPAFQFTAPLFCFHYTILTL